MSHQQLPPQSPQPVKFIGWKQVRRNYTRGFLIAILFWTVVILWFSILADIIHRHDHPEENQTHHDYIN